MCDELRLITSSVFLEKQQQLIYMKTLIYIKNDFYMET